MIYCSILYLLFYFIMLFGLDMAAGSSSLSWHYQIQALSPCEWFIVVFYYYLGSRHNHFGSSLLLGAEAADCWLFESLDVAILAGTEISGGIIPSGALF
jgi:hypothetical protein